ncbi:hypothetical protein GQ602_002215 [Ophiocordyceps camponoti-floridani]|uniref:Uncharacterized protein n=1 Tax=Ophiocordyceps camponoti-floridani TaxID=2030778 RepID=A0A8H4QA09_9HYPO|nr:hypothetical protein GQ602_002215 [Ophiocordyceps camponoti-floridani]
MKPSLPCESPEPIPYPLSVSKITYSCDAIQPVPLDPVCLGQDPRSTHMTACGLIRRFQNLLHALPPGMTRMMMDKMGLGRSEIKRHLRNSVPRAGTDTSVERLRWFESVMSNQTVCWPDHPDFTHHDFQEFGGLLSALLVRPETLTQAVPLRFMNLPPGYLTRNRVHYIYRASYDYQRVWSLTALVHIVSIDRYHRKDSLSLQSVRSIFDSWGGRVGRLLLAAMRDDGLYGCSYHKGCRHDRELRGGYGVALQPRDFAAALEHWLWSLEMNKPFAVTLGDVPDEAAPSTLWLVLD